jgi:hypothetical protein
MSSAHTRLVREACEWLAMNRIFAWPNQTGAAKIDGRFVQYGKLGSGDIIAVLPPHGRHAEFEAKTGQGRQRRGQKEHQRVVEAQGGCYLVFRSVEDLAGQLERHLVPLPQLAP